MRVAPSVIVIALRAAGRRSRHRRDEGTGCTTADTCGNDRTVAIAAGTSRAHRVG
jgi:hypothetical protein